MKKIPIFFVYSLIPILTLSIEDAFFLDQFSTGLQNPAYWLFSKALILPPVVILMLLGIGLAILLGLTKVNKLILIITVLFLVALLTGIFVGIFGKIETPKLFFEFQYWRSFVFFILLALLITKAMKIHQFEKFVDWFVLVQFIYSIYVLFMFLVFNQGQVSNVGRLVPIFAGDQLAFIVLACFILSARNAVRPNLYTIIAEISFILILLLSYRRTSMAAAIASIVFVAAFLMIRNGKGKRLLLFSIIGVFTVFIIGFVLWTTQRAAIESSFLFQRILSINPIWAGRQTNILLSSMGHNDDFLDGLDLVRQSPLLGKGLNTNFVLQRTSDWQADNLHSTMFSLWVKMGLPGLIFYLFVATYGIRFFFKGLRNKSLKSVWLVLFVISFSIYNFLLTIYANGVFLGYKNATCLAIYISGCYFISRELSIIYGDASLKIKDQGISHEILNRNPLIQSR